MEKQCWNTGCKKNGWIEIYGRKYCVKHWRQDYKYWSEIGLKLSLKLSNFNIRDIFAKQYESKSNPTQD
jgi:hypothetical protein